MKATPEDMDEVRNLTKEIVSLNNLLSQELHLRMHDVVWTQEIQNRVVEIEKRLLPLREKVKRGVE
jgi:hypothetical protein